MSATDEMAKTVQEMLDERARARQVVFDLTIEKERLLSERNEWSQHRADMEWQTTAAQTEKRLAEKELAAFKASYSALYTRAEKGEARAEKAEREASRARLVINDVISVLANSFPEEAFTTDVMELPPPPAEPETVDTELGYEDLVADDREDTKKPGLLKRLLSFFIPLNKEPKPVEPRNLDAAVELSALFDGVSDEGQQDK